MRKAAKKIIAVFMAFTMLLTISSDYHLNSVSADTEKILTTSEIYINGFQMKTNVTDSDGISFRTVYTAPDIGSQITVDNQKYTVNRVGTIFAKDPNTDGNYKNNILDSSFMLLNTKPYPQAGAEEGRGYKYIGHKAYDGHIVTLGFLATENGAFDTKDGYTSYIRTFLNMDEFLTNSFLVRGFMEASDQEGKSVIIYSKNIKELSIAALAYQVYVECKAADNKGHDYIYHTILNQLPSDNKYFLDTEVEFGWGPVIMP